MAVCGRRGGSARALCALLAAVTFMEIASAGCKRDEASSRGPEGDRESPGDRARRAGEAPAPASSAEIARAPTAWTLHGTIGHDIETHARLDSTEGGAIRGRYLYAKRGRWLELEGSVHGARVEIVEKDDAHRTTGRIVGTLTAGGGIDGEWQSPDKKRALALSWKPYDTSDPIAPFEIIDVAHKGTTKASGEHEACTHDLHVPVIVGAFLPKKEDDINALIDDPHWRANEACDDASAATVSFDVHKSAGKLVSLSLAHYAEGGSMMHGELSRDVYTFERPSGRRLFLADFVDTGSEKPRGSLRRALAARLRPAYRTTDANVDEWLDAMVEPTFSVGVTERALVFYDTNVVPHVIMGDRKFEIPFADIEAALASTTLGATLAKSP